MSLPLSSLSSELLLNILCSLSSPEDLYSAITASSRLYRIFAKYRLSISAAILLHAIPQNLEAVFLCAYRAQNIWKFVLEVNGPGTARRRRRQPEDQTRLEGLQQESQQILEQSDSAQGGQLQDIVSDSELLPKLWRFYRKFEHFVRLYTERALSALRQSLSTIDGHGKTTVTEDTRLKRAFFRCEVFICLFQFSQTHGDTDFAAPKTDPGSIYLDRFSVWEIEEITCAVQFYVGLIEELCEKIDDGFVSTVKHKVATRAPSVKEEKLDDVEYWLDYFCLRWFEDHTKTSLRTCHTEYLVSRGMLAVWKLTHAPFQEMRKMMVRSDFLAHDQPSLMLQLVYANGASNADTNPGWGWIWANGGLENAKWFQIGAGANCVLRNQGYVFWDKARLEALEEYQAARPEVKDRDAFPPPVTSRMRNHPVLGLSSKGFWFLGI
ncbi:hypothetical protein BJX99DRAFT_263431 [Aspergillus californicus]